MTGLRKTFWAVMATLCRWRADVAERRRSSQQIRWSKRAVKCEARAR